MNLGTLIGRLMYGELERVAPQEHRAPVAPRRRWIRGGGRAKALAELLAKHPEGLRVREIAALTEIDANTCNAYLSQMAEVEKSGKRRSYVYRLKNNPPLEA